MSTLLRATDAISSIGAQAGDYVADHGDHLTIMREVPAATLTAADRQHLRSVRTAGGDPAGDT
jgi:hypothetical protein